MTDLAAELPEGSSDALILRRLRQVVAMGEHAGIYRSADVVRIAEAHLAHPRTLRRALLNERQRADRLAVEVAALRQRQEAPKRVRSSAWRGPTVAVGGRVVVLKPYMARILDELITGAEYDDIAERLEITRPSVSNAVSRICQAFGVRNSRQVVAEVWSERAVVRVEDVRRRAA